jgi:hypothetical protein
MSVTLFDQIQYCQKDALPLLYSCVNDVKRIRKTIEKYGSPEVIKEFNEYVVNANRYYREMDKFVDSMKAIEDRTNEPVADFSIEHHKFTVGNCVDQCKYFDDLAFELKYAHEHKDDGFKF